jgi:hypothetical protein
LRKRPGKEGEEEENRSWWSWVEPEFSFSGAWRSWTALVISESSSCGDSDGGGLGSVQRWRRREYEGTVGVWGSRRRRRRSWGCFEDESDLLILLGETMVILLFRVFFALTALCFRRLRKEKDPLNSLSY